jgi:hypothetical protein
MGYRHSHSEREPFAQIPKYDKMLIQSNFSSKGVESEVHFRTACRSTPILLLVLLPTTSVLAFRLLEPGEVTSFTMAVNMCCFSVARISAEAANARLLLAFELKALLPVGGPVGAAVLWTSKCLSFSS